MNTAMTARKTFSVHLGGKDRAKKRRALREAAVTTGEIRGNIFRRRMQNLLFRDVIER